jgi:hypothetical protein
MLIRPTGRWGTVGVVILLLASLGGADEGRIKFDYQGELLDERGQRVNGTMVMDIGLYDSPRESIKEQEGRLLWSQKDVFVPVKRGVFSLSIGKNAYGQPDLDVNIFQKFVFLQIRVQRDQRGFRLNDILLPRVALGLDANGQAMILSASALESLKKGLVMPPPPLSNKEMIHDAALKSSRASELLEFFVAGEANLEAGQVVVFDDKEPLVVKKTTIPNDPKVAGVVTAKPGGILRMEKMEKYAKRTFVALPMSGIIPCKVTTENGPIAVGDLITTSSTPGFGMKSKPIKVGDSFIPRVGTYIGKALESWEQGEGTILIKILN